MEGEKHFVFRDCHSTVLKHQFLDRYYYRDSLIQSRRKKFSL